MQANIIRKDIIPTSVKPYVEKGYNVSVTIEINSCAKNSDDNVYIILDVLAVIIQRDTGLNYSCQSYNSIKDFIKSTLSITYKEQRDKICESFIECGYNDDIFDAILDNKPKRVIYQKYLNHLNDLSKQITIHDSEMEQIQNKTGRSTDSFGFSLKHCVLNNIMLMLARYRNDYIMTVQRKEHTLLKHDVFRFRDGGDDFAITVNKIVLFFKSQDVAVNFVNQYKHNLLGLAYTEHHKKAINVYDILSNKITNSLKHRNYGLFLSKRRTPRIGVAGYITVNQVIYMKVDSGNVDVVCDRVKQQYEKLMNKCESYDIPRPLLESEHLPYSYMFTNTATTDNNGLSYIECGSVSSSSVTKKNIKHVSKIKDDMDVYTNFPSATHTFKFHIPILTESNVQNYRKLLNYMILTKTKVNTVTLYPHTGDELIQDKILELLDEMVVG